MKLSELAKFVKDRETDLAPGSETMLLSAFVADFGNLSDALASSELVDNEISHAWMCAYASYELLTIKGTDFDISDLF